MRRCRNSTRVIAPGRACDTLIEAHDAPNAANYGHIDHEGSRSSKLLLEMQDSDMDWLTVEGDMIKARIGSKSKEYENFLATGMIPGFVLEGQLL